MRSVDDLTMYVYGLLDGPQERALRDHVETCDACTERCERIGAEHRLLEAALARDIPDSASRSKATEQVLARRGAPWRWFDFRQAGATVLILGLFLLLVVSAGLPRPGADQLIAAPPSPALMATAEPAPSRPVRRPPAPTGNGSEAAVCDLKIVMTWDGRANVDLEVQEPGGGHASMDHRNRFGVETYLVPRLKTGTYRVGAQLRGQGRSTVKFLVILFEGTDAEQRREECVILEKPGDLKFIRDITLPR